jgi:hypothetical protein
MRLLDYDDTVASGIFRILYVTLKRKSIALAGTIVVQAIPSLCQPEPLPHAQSHATTPSSSRQGPQPALEALRIRGAEQHDDNDTNKKLQPSAD